MVCLHHETSVSNRKVSLPNRTQDIVKFAENKGVVKNILSCYITCKWTNLSSGKEFTF